jgi:hypothetical protein
MASFLSWIQVAIEGQEQVLFLTDADVFGPHGRCILKDTKGRDWLGHNAIIEYYGVTQRYTKHEEQRFWDAQLPPEAAGKLGGIEQFMRHWGRIWHSGAFDNDDLCYLCVFATPGWGLEAWEQISRQGPSLLDLCYLISYAAEPIKTKAVNKLVLSMRELDPRVLGSTACQFPDSVRSLVRSTMSTIA